MWPTNDWYVHNRHTEYYNGKKPLTRPCMQKSLGLVPKELDGKNIEYTNKAKEAQVVMPLTPHKGKD